MQDEKCGCKEGENARSGSCTARRRRDRWLIAAVCLSFVIFGIVVVEMSGSGGSVRQAEERFVVEDDGVLADVRGEDVVQRLQAEQAAVKREMAWIRRRLTASGGVSSGEVDLARQVLEAEAAYAELMALVRQADVGQAKLVSIVMGCQLGLKVLEDQMRELERAVEGN